MLGAENVGGVWRMRADVAAAFLAGPLSKMGLGGSGQKRTLLPLAAGLENASMWAATQTAYGFVVLMSLDGRQPGELWAVAPDQGAALATVSAGQWCVFLDAGAIGWAGQIANAQQQAGFPTSFPAGTFSTTKAGPAAPPPAAPAPVAADAPPGWNGAPTVIDPGSGAIALREDYRATFGGWLATRAAVRSASQADAFELPPAAQAPSAPNALATAVEFAGVGAYVLVSRAAPMVLAPLEPAKLKSAAQAGLLGDWFVVAGPAAALGVAPQVGLPPGFTPAAPGFNPSQQPQPQQQAPGGLLGALGGLFPGLGGQQPQQGPQAPAGGLPPAQQPQPQQQAPGGLLGALGGLLQGIPQGPGLPPFNPPQQAPAGGLPPIAQPQGPVAPPSTTPGIDALPQAMRAQVLAAVVAGDVARLEQIAAALGQSAPQATAEIKKMAVDIKAARKMSAIAEGRLVNVRPGDNPSHWAAWYTGDGTRWKQLLSYNEIKTQQVNGVTQPDSKRWFPGAEIELPPDWQAAKGMPPMLKSGQKAAPPAPKPAPAPAAPGTQFGPPTPNDSPYPSPSPMGESARLRGIRR